MMQSQISQYSFSISIVEVVAIWVILSSKLIENVDESKFLQF